MSKKKVIRMGMFETNSSSTHSIVMGYEVETFTGDDDTIMLKLITKEVLRKYQEHSKTELYILDGAEMPILFSGTAGIIIFNTIEKRVQIYYKDSSEPLRKDRLYRKAVDLDAKVNQLIEFFDEYKEFFLFCLKEKKTDE